MSIANSIAVVITARCGRKSGTPFSDFMHLSDIENTIIKQITIWHKGIIYGLKAVFPVACSETCVNRHLLQVKYISTKSKEETELPHGTEFGTATLLDLENDEFITGVEGYSTESWVTQLTFVTNKRLLSLPVATRQGIR